MMYGTLKLCPMCGGLLTYFKGTLYCRRCRLNLNVIIKRLEKKIRTGSPDTGVGMYH